MISQVTNSQTLTNRFQVYKTSKKLFPPVNVYLCASLSLGSAFSVFWVELEGDPTHPKHTESRSQAMHHLLFLF